jgi:hypothetical protein
MYKLQSNEAYQTAVRAIQGAQLNTDRIKENKTDIEQQIDAIIRRTEETKLDISRLVEEMNNVSLSPNYAGYIRSVIGLFELHKEYLQGRADSDQELSVVNDGIESFKQQLALLKTRESDWVTPVSP